VEAQIAVRVADGRYPTSRIRLAPKKDALYTSGAVARDGKRIAAHFSRPGNPQKMWDGPFLWPSTGVVTSVFGARRSYGGRPPSGAHSGLDLANKEGTLIVAPAPGRVALCEWMESFGNVVLLDHGQGVFSYYLHMKAATVAEGAVVQTGDALGIMGREGVATGPHLHWSLTVAGERVDPVEWTERAIP
jgi:murein DD-endopeptidase MepM/ murein hydrolase activator NlpD